MKTPKIFIPNKDLNKNINKLLVEKLVPNQCGEAEIKVRVEREEKKDHKSYEFLLSDAEIGNVLKKLPAKYLEGLEKIVITPPLNNEDYKNYGRYVPGGVYLFRHQKSDGKFEIVVGGNEGIRKLTPEEFKIENYKTLLHEIGHHVGIKDCKNYSEDFAKDFVERFLYLLE